MRHQKAFGSALWLIGLALAHLFLFLLPREVTASVWITYGFTLIAFFSQLALWIAVWKKGLTPEMQFLHTPLLLFSVCYLAGQLICCILFALLPATVKIAILANALFLCAMWALQLAAVLACGHAEKVDRRQKNHHTKL